MKTRYHVFEDVCRKAFSFLQAFGFDLVDATTDNYGCRITYKSNNTAIRIDLDRALMTVDCYKLKGGAIPSYPVFFDPKDEFLVFDVNDLLIIRTGNKIDQDPKRMYEESYMTSKIQEFAAALRAHASDVLQGDFGVLPSIKERVVRRAKELEHEQ